MKQNSLILYDKKELMWSQKEIPPLKKDEVLIKTIAGAISIGAELPQYLGSDITEETPHYPKETGYESYGEIIEIGEEVNTLKIGDRVIAFYGHKNYEIVMSQETILVPKGIHCTDALLTILSCDAAKGVLKVNPKPDDRVLVTGMGTMGLLTAHFLKEYMNVNHVDVLEPDPARGNIARQLGVQNVFSDMEECPKDYYNYGLECSGYKDAFNTLQESLLQGAGLCILSDGNRDIFELQPTFYEKELDITSSSDGWNYKKHSEWYFEYVLQKDSILSKLFELKIGKEELIQCFEDISNGKVNPLKVLIEY